jgi:hypothetical protein
MFCEHVGLFRLSPAEIARTDSPHCSPLRARKAESQKTKKQLRSTTVSTPRLLMAAIKSVTSLPILGITWTPHSQLTSHQLLVLPFFRIIIHLLPHSCQSRLLPWFGTPGASLHLRDNLSFASDQRPLDALFTHVHFTLCPIFASVGVSSGLRRHPLGYVRQVTTIR